MKRFLQMAAAAVCLGTTAARAANPATSDSLTMADFAHSIKLAVDGYTGESPLTNFPVLVRVSETGIPGFHYADMSAKNKTGTTTYGYDLAFFAEDGTRLASENDTWTHNGESLAWVKLPEMTKGTKFFMCYNVADGVMVTNANPWTDYVGVWHLGETGQIKPIFDSTVNELVGTNYSTSGAGSVSVGAIGSARKIATNNAHDKGIIVDVLSDPAKKAVAESLGTDFHASFWMMAGDGGNNYVNLKWGNLLGRRKGDYGKSWGVAFHGDQSDYAAVNYMRVFSGSTTVKTTTNPIGEVLKQNDGIWKKVDVVWKYASNDNTPVADVYTNGVFVESVALNEKVKQEDANIGIGCSTQDRYYDKLTNADGRSNADKGRRFNGSMDEVRLHKSVPSADWVKADYDTVNNPGFVVISPDELTIIWAAGDAPGMSSNEYDSVEFAGMVQSLGQTAASCDIECKVWPASGSEPENWTSLTNGLAASDTFDVVVSGLMPSTAYSYKLQAVGNDGLETNSVSGAFTTANGLTVEWKANSGTAGFRTISYDFAKVGGTVTALGGASSCAVQAKYWIAGGSEPEEWTTLQEGLVLNNETTATISGLAPGTTYGYALRALGDDGSVTDVLLGEFTTLGDTGETIGSPDTHFYNDGTNSYWVANEFERYLPFTVTGYTGTETLTNFPVMVDVRKKDTNGFTYDDFYHAGGRDIVFVDEKGHIIPHEIDTWNPNGMSLIWVRLPEMVNGTTFTMCYRSPLVNPPVDPGNAFERYVGVWHMNEKADGIVDVIDSTTNNLVGETHPNSLAYGNGRIGGARRVAQQPGTSSTYGNIVVYDHDDILRTGVGNVFTYSCWSKLADNAPGWACLVSRRNDDFSTGWGIQYHDQKESTEKLRVWSGNNGKNNSDFFSIKGSGYSHTDWAYWTFVFDGNGPFGPGTNGLFHAYYNGDELPGTANGLPLRYPIANDDTADYDNLVIGGQEIGTGALNGWVDECRYSKGIRSTDWIKAEYDSMLQVDKPFVTKGEQVGRGDETLVPVVVWEQGVDLPNTVIDVSYAYVQFAGTVTYCGSGADTCFIEYQIWADGETEPTRWTTLLDDATPGTKFSIPVFGLKQDMPYNFRIRAVNEVNGELREARECTGSFRTSGNVNESAADGELLRVDNRFVHMYRAGGYTFTTPDYVTNIELVVVGGGGAGGYKIGGGGGGGGVFYSQSYSVTTSTTYRIIVGRGGTAPTNTTTASSAGNGEYSYFALDSDPANPLVSVPGGGGGGSCNTDANVVNGAEGASGGGAGGRGDTATAGATGGTAQDGGIYGHNGGDGNHKPTSGDSGSDGAYAAGGGGGGRRAGLSASSDKYYGGGAGGSGVACDVLGEMLYFGAGGGGGYMYSKDPIGYTKPGAGGSGIGGNAADVANGTLATSGVENTGAGGGGGSMTAKGSGDKTYWQGGDGGDGVVIISYEVHGRDPVADEPRISMTRCAYDEDSVTADIDYRLYWAGVQNDSADILVHYSTVSSNELDDVELGVMTKVAEGAVGVGNVAFTPPEVGYTYWVRLVARKSANSYAFSDEIASFLVPAITLNGATWTESEGSPDDDFATVSYKLHDVKEDTHLYCYWSESRDALTNNAAEPSGDGVFFVDLGANTGTSLSSTNTFNLSAAEGFVRNRTYYIRLASGDDQGMKRFLSKEIIELDTAEKPATVLESASWEESNVATVGFTATVGKLDPSQTELVALYSLVESDVKSSKPETKDSVAVIGLGVCSDLALDDASSSASFPLWSEAITNYYVRLALSTNVVVEADGVATTNRVIVADSYSPLTKEISVSHAIEANTLLYIVTANPKTACYGDEPLPLDYTLEYAGQTEGWGWNHKYALQEDTALVCYESTNPTPVEVSSISPSGNYPIAQGTLALQNGGVEKTFTDEETGVESRYQYKLTFSGATYTITNAVFSATIADVTTNYTGDAFDTSGLVMALSDVRNDQPVTFLYRAGTNDWSSTMPSGYTDVGKYTIQFKATAPSHDDVRGSFTVTIEPAELAATISTPNLGYTGDAQKPVVATNVTGLVRPDLNALTCEFRDAAGEWQSEVPSFTAPGEYKLYFRVSAPNHKTFVTNCTFTIEGWDFPVNLDGSSGRENAIDINVSDPGWLLRHSGHTGEQFSDEDNRYSYLNETCANGLKLWQNYVIGETNLSEKLVATIMQRGSRVAADSFVVHFAGVSVLRNTGLDVRFRLDQKLKGESEWTQGALTDRYDLNVPLAKDDTDYDPTGLYVFNIVLVPTNELYTGEAVLSSVATIGVLRVSSALTNTVVAVPWQSMSVDSETNVDVTVSEVVNPNGLGTGDKIQRYDAETGDFNRWESNEDGGWDKIATISTRGVSSSSAEVTRLSSGGAFWLVRSNPSDYIYLVGRYTGEDYEVELAGGTSGSPGYTLVANPTMDSINLSALNIVDDKGVTTTPDVGDLIKIQGAGGNATYFRNAANTAWGCYMPQRVKGRLQNVFTECGTVPAGTGFWYISTNSLETLKIKFEEFDAAR